MKRDLRTDPRFLSVEAYFAAQLEPVLGVPSNALEVQLAPDGASAAIAALVWEEPAGLSAQRIGLVPCSRNGSVLGAAEIELIGADGDDLHPRWSPTGETLAFISDRAERSHFRLYLYDAATREITAHATGLDDSIESLAWSPDGSALVLQTVGRGADRAGAQGSGSAPAGSDDEPDWLPVVEESVPANLWRRAYVYRPADRALTLVSPLALTVWEAAWCADDALVAVVSDNPREGAWHAARFVRIDLASGDVTTLHAPAEEIGLPAATRDGRYAAIVAACCSDRTIVAGDVIVFDLAAGGRSHAIDTHGVDVTFVCARDARTLVYAGIRGFETVIGEIDCPSGSARETYATRETFGRRYPSVSVARDGSYGAVVHAYTRPPAIVRIADGRESVIVDLAVPGDEAVAADSTIEEVRWAGRDGLAIDGLLVRPRTPAPHPVVVIVHGGPVGAFTNAWRMSTKLAPLLAAHGYAVLHPNPRGSSGRGQDFARMVRGDMNGEDTHDIIAGVEALIARGIADPARIAVTGVSYGGMMSAWIITQTRLFAAAIAVSPVTDMVSQHFTSNIPNFDTLFFASDPADPHGKHVMRSAIRYARDVSTPTLTIAGALDRCTPPGQAVEFHRALVEAGVPSELVIYPLEGHGVRQHEAFVDYCTRILAWLERYAGGPAAVGAAAEFATV